MTNDDMGLFILIIIASVFVTLVLWNIFGDYD